MFVTKVTSIGSTLFPIPKTSGRTRIRVYNEGMTTMFFTTNGSISTSAWPVARADKEEWVVDDSVDIYAMTNGNSKLYTLET